MKDASNAAYEPKSFQSPEVMKEKGDKKSSMEVEMTLVGGISGSTNFFHACEIGDYSYVECAVDHKKREWSEYEIMIS